MTEIRNRSERYVDIDHKAKIAWVKFGDMVLASFCFSAWGGAEKASIMAHEFMNKRIETDQEKIERYRYVLEGVLGAIKTGRNEPLMAWKKQIEIALDI